MEKAHDLTHGVTLEKMLEFLVEHCGWEEMAGRIHVRCFQNDPNMKSSLHFLRRTPWARKKVEALYLEKIKDAARKKRKEERS